MACDEGDTACLLAANSSAVDELLLVVSTGFILLMQAGFALVENGTVRSKNSRNILIKNMFDAAAGAVMFFLFGFGIAFGLTCRENCDDPENALPSRFIGTQHFAGTGFAGSEDNKYTLWIFQYSFAATASTIVSGSLAERTKLPSYMLFSALMTGFIYPVVVAWTWGGGWLTQNGFHDFAGTGIVHMVGGVAGLVGALIIRPRYGKEKDASLRPRVDEIEGYKATVDRFEDKAAFEQWMKEESNDTDFEPNSIPFVVVGTVVLWVSWLFFNGGSTASMYAERENGISKIILNTILSGTCGGLTASVAKPLIMQTYSHSRRYDVSALCNGLLAGLVAITGACDRVDPWAAIVIGIVGGIVYSAACKLCDVMTADDPIEASSVHGFAGMWGLIAVGIFDNVEGLVSSAESGKGKFLLWQLIGMFAIVLWVALLSAIYFFIMKKAGLLRVDLLEEIMGLDIAEMGSTLKVNKQMEKAVLRSASLRAAGSLGRMNSKVDEEPVQEFGTARALNTNVNDE